MRTVLQVGFLFAATIPYGQAVSAGSCSDELTKSEGDNHRIRINIGVSEALIQKRVFPDMADLHGTKVNSTVIIKALVDKSGAVRCADSNEGDANLRQRSVEAAKQWRFKPFLLNGQPLIFETPIELYSRKAKLQLVEVGVS